VEVQKEGSSKTLTYHAANLTPYMDDLEITKPKIPLMDWGNSEPKPEEQKPNKRGRKG
jgi:hypothetical protein